MSVPACMPGTLTWERNRGGKESVNTFSFPPLFCLGLTFKRNRCHIITKETLLQTDPLQMDPRPGFPKDPVPRFLKKGDQ